MAAWGLVLSLDPCSLLGAFPIPLIKSALPRSLTIAPLWGVLESLMRRNLDSEVVEGTDGLLPPLPLAVPRAQPA